MEKEYKILTLDGGGSKGMYTLGVLKELEKALGSKLYEHFDLIYGTSTGSIIASLIALGYSVSAIEKLYFKLIPKIMGGQNKLTKSYILKKEADKIFKKKTFDDFKTGIGIVSMNYDEQKPLIFKKDMKQAHGMQQSFKPGFGCSISDAVQSSCVAYPVFDFKKIITENQGEINVIDGGFVANNPTLFALIDAHKAIGFNDNQIKIISIGAGRFVEKPLNFFHRILKSFETAQWIERVMSANTTTNEELTKLLFPKLNIVRINDTFNQPEYGTNLIEKDETKLKKMLQLGWQSYANHEKEINALFNLKS